MPGRTPISGSQTLVRRAVALAIAAIALSCGDGGAGPDADDRVGAVIIAGDSATTYTGASITLSALVHSAGGRVLAAAPSWRSLDTTIATVSAGGTTTGVRPGRARIVASRDGVADTIRVGILPRITQVNVQPPDTLRAIGVTQTLLASARAGAQPYDAVYVFTSRNDAIATISATGVITARGNGTTWLVVSDTGGVRDSAQVVVRQRAKTVWVDDIFVDVDSTRALVVEVADSLGHPMEPTSVRWEWMDSTMISIGAGGLVRGRSPGTTYGWAIVDQARSEPFRVVVTPPPALEFEAPLPLPVVIGLGQLGSGVRVLANHPSTDLVVTLTQRHPERLGIPATVSITGGPGFGAAVPYVGRALGTDTVIASAPGHRPDTLIFDVVVPFLVGSHENFATGSPPGRRVSVTLSNSGTGPPPKAAEPVTLYVTVSDPAVLRPTTTTVRIPVGGSGAEFRVENVGPGTARVIVTDSAGRYAPYESDPIVVQAARVGMFRTAHPPHIASPRLASRAQRCLTPPPGVKTLVFATSFHM